MKVLIFSDWYAPAYKAGGPVRSLVNLVERFKSEIEFFIFTTNHDLQVDVPLPEVSPDQWLIRDNVSVYYRSSGRLGLKQVRKLIVEINPDHIYLNSMFSDMIIPMLAAHATGKIIVAPRGMLMDSALRVKFLKKYLYLFFLRQTGIASNLRFHATNEVERKVIQRVFPMCKEILVAPNLPSTVNPSTNKIRKDSGHLELIFVGRVNPIKNLLFLLQLLPSVKGIIHLHIAATQEDDAYLKSCRIVAASLPGHIQCHWHLDAPHETVLEKLKHAHLMVLPTQGENFGHAIFESLAAGCPVLISDNTPWRNLELKKAGMDIPLSISDFTTALNSFVDMNNEVWQEYRLGALAMAEAYKLEMKEDITYGKIFN